ncbi:hypothetical protein SOVF_213130, partial [Spinacia oleracea]
MSVNNLIKIERNIGGSLAISGQFG